MNEPETTEYVLGHNELELQRLITQSQFLGELTAEVFRRAGIVPGMRVLDVGCGAGDVSFLAASLTGPSGYVVGVDKSAEAVALARKRAAAARLTNVTFLQSDLEDLKLSGEFDALVGRLVLLYLRDPAKCLRQWWGYVKKEGAVIFQEMVMTSIRSFPPAPVYDDTGSRIIETFRRAGAEVDMGLKLYHTFLDSGLPAPAMSFSGRIEGGPDALTYNYLADVVRSLLPMMERLGVWTANDAQVDSLASRIQKDVVARGSVVIPPPLVGAWAKLG